MFIAEVSSLAGVCISTVSRVINDHPHVSPVTARRVHAVIPIGVHRGATVAALQARAAVG